MGVNIFPWSIEVIKGYPPSFCELQPTSSDIRSMLYKKHAVHSYMNVCTNICMHIHSYMNVCTNIKLNTLFGSRSYGSMWNLLGGMVAFSRTTYVLSNSPVKVYASSPDLCAPAIINEKDGYRQDIFCSGTSPLEHSPHWELPGAPFFFLDIKPKEMFLPRLYLTSSLNGLPLFYRSTLYSLYPMACL